MDVTLNTSRALDEEVHLYQFRTLYNPLSRHES